MDSYEDRLRRKAYSLWEQEGRVAGREDVHWEMARELVAIEDDQLARARPSLSAPGAPEAGEAIERSESIANAGESSGLAERPQGPRYREPPVASGAADSDRPTVARAAIEGVMRPLAAFAIDAVKLAIMKRLQDSAGAKRRRRPGA
jgi:hypothetical protein